MAFNVLLVEAFNRPPLENMVVEMSKHRKRRRRTYLNRSGWTNRHHIRAKARGGSDYYRNIILLDDMRHAAFHLLFGNMTFTVAAALLLRADKIKGG